MKILTTMILGLMLCSDVNSANLDSITSVEKFSHAMQHYEILTVTPGGIEADIHKYRENITTFWRKNKNLLRRLKEKTFVDTIPLEYRVIDFYGNALHEKLGQQMNRFKKRSSPAQTSGVLWYAHNKEIKGEGVRVYFPDADASHRKHVGGIIEQIAPSSLVSKSTLWHMLEILKLIPVSDWFTLSPKLEAFKVSNWSIGSNQKSNYSLEYLLFLFQMSGTNPLIVKAAGNDGHALTSNEAADHIFFQELSKRFPDRLETSMIVVGSLDGNNSISGFSNFPGDSLEIQRNFIYALGGDVLARVDDQYMRCSGTSMSNPSVTGVAILIGGLYPEFSKTDIKECILESARQSFFVYGYQVDAQDKPDIWGRGILDGAQALAYAKLKSEGKTKQEIKAVLKDKKDRIENLSASKIQSVFRTHKKSS